MNINSVIPIFHQVRKVRKVTFCFVLRPSVWYATDLPGLVLRGRGAPDVC